MYDLAQAFASFVAAMLQDVAARRTHLQLPYMAARNP